MSFFAAVVIALCAYLVYHERRSSQRFESLFRESPSGIALYQIITNEENRSTDYRFVDVNRAFEEIMDLKAQDVIGKTVSEVLSETEQGWIRRCGDAALKGMPQEFEQYAESLGKHFTVRAFQTVPGCFVTVFHETAHNKQMEQVYYRSRDQLKENEKKFLQSILDNAPVGIWLTAPDGKRLLMNKYFREQVGINTERCLVTPDEKRVCRITDEKTLAANEPQQFEEVLTFADGEKHVMRTIKTVLRKENGEIMGVLGIGVDITEQKKAEEELRYITFHDSLTGLYNRRYFEGAMRRLDKDNQLPVSIIMADLDGLKLVNDSLGHHEGDKLLIKFSQVLKKACGEGSVIARWGGDEFVVLLPKTSEKQVNQICSRIRRFCAQAGDKPIALNVSLGSATKSISHQDFTDILKQAENQMYREKITSNDSSRSGLLASFRRILEERTPESEDHIYNLRVLGNAFGRQLGLTSRELNDLDLLSVLHDIGQGIIPESILHKDGPLTESELAIVRRHCEVGYRIALVSHNLVPVAEGILAHHEHWDGTGYPQGVRGKEIPLLARIFAIIDAFEVSLFGRHEPALSLNEVLDRIEEGAGTQFDPKLVRMFLQLVEETDITAQLKNSNQESIEYNEIGKI